MLSDNKEKYREHSFYEALAGWSEMFSELKQEGVESTRCGGSLFGQRIQNIDNIVYEDPEPR